MRQRAFYFSDEKKLWQECLQEDFCQKEIQELPAFLICGSKQGAKTLLWDIREGKSCVKDNPCGFWGRLPALKQEEQIETVRIPFRWCVVQRDPLQPVLVFLDLLQLRAYRKGQEICFLPPHWLRWSLAIDAAEQRMVAIPQAFGFAKRSCWRDGIPEAASSEGTGAMPELVTEAVLEALRDNIQAAWGLRPGITAKTTGMKKLLAFVLRPYDLNIVYLHRLIGKDFARVFLRSERSNFPLLCQYLKQQFPDCLRKAYAVNPYAVVAYLLMRRLGFHDINLIRRFFSYTRLFGMELEAFFYDAAHGIVCTAVQGPGESYCRSLVNVCGWMIEVRGEVRAASLMEKACRSGWSEKQTDLVRMFQNEYEGRRILSVRLRKRFLKEGLTECIHDAAVRERNQWYNKDGVNQHILYTQEELACAGNFAGYDFCLPPDTDALSELGRCFHNCVGSYARAVLHKETLVVYVKQAELYLACLEVQNREIRQMFGICNKKLPEDLAEICLEWNREKWPEKEMGCLPA